MYDKYELLVDKTLIKTFPPPNLEDKRLNNFDQNTNRTATKLAYNNIFKPSLNDTSQRKKKVIRGEY